MDKHQLSTHHPAKRCVLQDTNGRTPILVGDGLIHLNVHDMHGHPVENHEGQHPRQARWVSSPILTTVPEKVTQQRGHRDGAPRVQNYQTSAMAARPQKVLSLHPGNADVLLQKRR